MHYQCIVMDRPENWLRFCESRFGPAIANLHPRLRTDMKNSTRLNWILATPPGVMILTGLTALRRNPRREHLDSLRPPRRRLLQQAGRRRLRPADHKLHSGEVKLEFDEKGLGYLKSLLKALDINVDSQGRVFSKTSFQSPKIDPRAPRAIFFNDEVSVGSVQTSDVLELAALDPKLGVIFYTMSNHKGDKPEFDRRDVCLQCHQGINTEGVPGILVSSVFPAGDGMPAFRGSQKGTDGRSNLEDRWGGWYVTGTHGGQRHMGNAVAHDPSAPTSLETYGTQNLTSLDRKVNLNRPTYLTKPVDIVALMTLEHQTRMTTIP